MDDTANVEEYRQFLEYFRAHVDPNDQLPVRVPGYNLIEAEVAGEVVDWLQQYLIQMRCPQVLLAPIVNEVLQETKKSYLKIPKQCGFDGYAYNPLKLSTIVISHTNTICERLLDNAELNEILSKSSAAVLSCTPRHCVKAIKNTRRKMEDRHVCISDFNGMFAVKDSEPTSFYGVFDGHGGQDAAIYTAAHLCYNIAKSPKYPHNIDGAIRESFVKTDEAFIDKSDKHAIYSGTTALVCIYRAIEKRLFVGWVGDSQALLVCEGKVCQIVSPHVPSLESERSRIEKMGGVIVNWSGSCRVNGQLAVSRAIGDASHKPFITSEPDTSSISLEGKEDFLIVASDGLWESLTEDYIALFVYRKIAENPGIADTIADKLIECARKGTSDNITVVVVFFKDPHLIAKSSWLNKMEAAYDKNSSNSAFDNDKISLSATLKQSYNDTNDARNLDDETSGDVVDNNQRFEDDFGPETDVDGLDDAHATKSPIEYQANNNICEFNLSNGVKPFSLENKIIQHLSEQNVDFLADSNPFKDENCEQYHDQHTLDSDYLDQMVAENGRTSPDLVVDNKIIDALESFGVTNGEREKYEIEGEEHVSELTDESRKLPEILDLSEKADCSHEKQNFSSDLVTDEPIDEFIHHHSTDMFDHHMDHETSQEERENTPIASGTGCLEGSVGEESEEEDEWNYFKGDKKTEEQTELTVNKEIPKLSEVDPAAPPHQQQDEASESLVEPVQTSDTNFEAEELFEPVQAREKNTEAESLLCNFTSESAVEEEIAHEESDKVDETKKIKAVEFTDNKEDLLLGSEFDKQQEEAVVPTEKELTNTEESEFSNPLVDEASLIPACLDYPSVCEEPTAESEPILSEQETLCAELVKVEGTNLNRVEEPADAELETSIDEELQHPNSLSLEMASKLNPEAKEFVPTGSPTQSDPTSPVSNIPSALHNSYLLISDDTVIAQSPKKGTNTMDNIDVPAEDDFQHEMNNRPHELEKSEYTNGNGNSDATVRSHSPGSEPSYQELNLKEAMQCDEKLECEYNDEKQTATEESSSEMSNEKNLLNVLRKEENAMNMSFYEGRDEALLSNNSDELNKVQMLSDEEEVTEPNSNGADQVQSKSVECFEGKHISNTHNLLEDKMDTVDYTISAVATQVVNDIAALVDQMQIEEPLMNDLHLSKSNSDLFEIDANAVDVAADIVDLTAGYVESSDDTVGSSADLVEFKVDPVDINVGSVGFNADPIGFDADLVELSANPVEFNTDPIEFKADLVDYNVDTEKLKTGPLACMTEDAVEEQKPEFLLKEVDTAEGKDTIINLEKQNEEKHIEDFVEEIEVRLQHSELDYRNPIEREIASSTIETTEAIENTEAIDTDELTSPIVEFIQQEVTTENEFIMDESVLSVPSPTQTAFEAETSTLLLSAPTGTVHVKDSALLVTNDVSSTEQIPEKIEDVVSALVVLDTTSSVPVETISLPSIEQVANETKSETVVLAPAVTLVTSSVTKSADTKTAISKTLSGSTKSTAKIPSTSADKKPTTTSKHLTKPTAKPMSAVKSATTAIKKPSTVTSALAAATSTKATTVSKSTTATATTVSKSTTATATTRSSVTISASSKATVEKKTPLAAKKPLTAAVNGDLKATPAARKPLTSTVKSTASVRSTTTTSSSSTTARPSSTSAKPNVASKPIATTSRPTPSAPARTSSASTRTSASLPTVKHRTTPLTANKTAGATTSTATSMVPSKSSQVPSTAKRMSSVQSAPKPAASTVTKMSVAPKSSSVNIRTSTVPKTSSTPAGLRKSSTTPNKKQLSSPSTKSASKASPPGKPAPIKAPVPKLIETVSIGDDHTNLMDLDKQLKNDNNQLITKNGIESQMIVIDSAAD